MAIAFRASASAPSDGNSVASRSVTIPASVQVGDVLLLASHSRNTPTAPSGWTALVTFNATYGGHRVWARTAVVGDAGSTVTITQSPADRMAVALVAYSGAVAPTTAATGAENFLNGTTITHPSVSAVSPSAWLVAGFTDYQDSTSSTQGVATPLTSRVAQSGIWSHVAFGDQALTAAGATGTRTTTLTAQPYSAVPWSLILEPSDRSIPVGRATSSTSARPVTVTQATVATHSVYGATTPSGTFSVFTDGSPSIVLGETFYRYGGVGGTWSCVGGRVWTPVGVPATITIRLYADPASTGGVTRYVHNLDSAPVREVTVPTNPGGWTEARWGAWPLTPDGQRWMIGYTFPTAPTDYVAATNAYSDNSPVYSLDGFKIVKSETEDLSSTYGPVDRGYYQIGTSTPAGTLGATGYGVDTIVGDGTSTGGGGAQSIPVGRANSTQLARPLAVTRAGTAVAVGRATSIHVARTLAPAPGALARTVGRATSTHVARALGMLAGGQAIPVGRATSAHTARPLTPTSGALALALGRAASTNTARPLAVTTPSSTPTFRAASDYDGGVATTHAITIPATVQVGDVLLMPVATSYYLTTPAGWTRLSRDRWDDPRTGYLFTKAAATGDAGSTLTLGYSDTNAYELSASVVAYAHANVPASGVSSATSASAISYPGVTAAVGNLYVATATHEATGTTTVAYTGTPALTQRTTGSFSNYAVGVADRPVTVAGSVGSAYQATSGATGPWSVLSILLTYKAGVDPQAVPVGRATEADAARPITVPIQGQSIPVGRATTASTASPLGATATPGTDTHNRVGGRLREGLGVAVWEPPVVPAPSSSAPVLAYDVANAFGTVTRVGSQPSYTVTTARKVRHTDRILVGGRDVTYFRGIPTPLPSYQLIAPLLYGPATLVLPQVAGSFERLGAGDLKWLHKGASVKVQRVDETGTVVATDYKGVVIAFNVDGKNLTVEVGGQASGRAALVNKQTPLWHRVNDAGTMAYDAITSLGLHFEPRLGPDTGIPLATWGGLSWLDYINELCAKAQDRDGTQWTLMPDNTGAYRFRRKDTTTVHATVYLDDAWAVGQLRRDIAEEPNRVYMTGVNPQGRRVRNAVYPGLNQGQRPPYPYADHGHTFGQGTTDADTETGDGITVMVARLWAMKYLDRADTPGGYDKDAKGAVRDLQEDAGLPATGTMTWDTWRALFDLSATGYSLRGSHIEPMAQRSKVKPWLRTSSGAKLARNPAYDPTVLRVDLNVDAGVGFKASQLRDWARAELATEDNWVGTIALNTGAVIDGLHNPGDPLDAGQVKHARSLNPGQNLWAPQFMGGTLFHISGVSVDASGVVTLSVDTRARDTMKVWEVIQRNRDTRANPARAWIAQHRSSTMTQDAVGEWDAAGGVVDKVRCTGNAWTVFEVPAGQEGTIRSLRVHTDNSPAEFVMAVFGRKVTPAWLGSKVPQPLTAPSTFTTTTTNTDGTTNTVTHTRADNAAAWESEKVRNRLDDRFLLYAAGTNQQPCGYSPGKKTNENGDATGDRITGKHYDDAGVSYHTFAEPVLYVAIYPDRDTVVQAGRVMWNQLEAGS